MNLVFKARVTTENQSGFRLETLEEEEVDMEKVNQESRMGYQEEELDMVKMGEKCNVTLNLNKIKLSLVYHRNMVKI